MIHFETHDVEQFLDPSTLDEIRPRAEQAHEQLMNRTGRGSDFLGWRDLVTNPDDALLADIDAVAAEVRAEADALVCIGIGGSYLGARAVIEALSGSLNNDNPEVLFAGHHMGPDYMPALMRRLEGKSVYVNVISKSGTTLEPALAFRLLLDWMKERFEDLDKRIIVTTDRDRGALNELQSSLGTRKYVIPDDVGGRFSVLTPVGLLPIAVAGNDIRSLLYGAVLEARHLRNPESNAAINYATYRYLLHEAGFKVEALSTFDPRLNGIGSWWQQLFGESEGKEGKGLLPMTLEYTTDLHALGQYVQQGQRILLETFLISEAGGGPTVPVDPTNADQLNYLAGKTVSEINRVAYEGTRAAHADGGVPVATVFLPSISTESIGALLYFFEHAVAVSGHLLEVNPFDQPGVEAYKNEMFKRLGKPS